MVTKKPISHSKRAEEQEVAQQHHADVDIPLRYDANAAPDAGDRGQGGHARNYGDHDDLGRGAGVQAKQFVQTGGDLRRAQTKRRGNAEYGAEHGQEVDRVAKRPVNAIAEQRIQGGTQRQRQLFAKAEVREAQADDDVHRPSVKAPVKVDHAHGVRGAPFVGDNGTGVVGVGIVRITRAASGVEIEQRLRDGEKQNADAEAGREQHRQPRKSAELGARVVAAQAHAAVSTRHKVEGGEQHHADREHVIPTQRRLDPALGGAVDGVGEFNIEDGEKDERQHHGFGGQRHSRVQTAQPAGFRHRHSFLRVAFQHVPPVAAPNRIGLRAELLGLRSDSQLTGSFPRKKRLNLLICKIKVVF